MEFGAGHSTVWFSLRSAAVFSVEHDPVWWRRVCDLVGSNALVMLAVDEAAYVGAGGVGRYDLVLIDGEHRGSCCWRALDVVSPRGVVVLDDSQLPEFAAGVGALLAGGFRRLDFWGFAPGISYEKCTTLFYRDGNCLGL